MLSRPKPGRRTLCIAGEVGYVIAGIKDVHGAPVGDTITLDSRPCAAQLAGFRQIQPRVFAGLFPVQADDFETLRVALDKSGFSPYLHFDNFNGVVDGVDEIRKKIRWQVKNGADLNKFCATAGVLSEEESVGAPQFSFEEMQAIVEESARWGRKVAAHAHGAEGIKLAVKDGVTSIEHGSLIDAEGVAMMKERGTFLVPTVHVGYSVEKHGLEWKLPQKLIEKGRRINQQKREVLQRAFRAGVKVAYGTDAGVFK